MRAEGLVEGRHPAAPGGRGAERRSSRGAGGRGARSVLSESCFAGGLPSGFLGAAVALLPAGRQREDGRDAAALACRGWRADLRAVLPAGALRARAQPEYREVTDDAVAGLAGLAVESLTVNHAARLTDSGLNAAAMQHPELRALTLRSPCGLSGGGLVAAAAAMSNLRKLELGCRGVHFDGNDVVAALRHQTGLTELGLTGLRSLDLLPLRQRLRRMPGLTSLDLSHSHRLTRESLALFRVGRRSPAFARPPALRSLALRCCHVSSLSGLLPLAASLTDLDLESVRGLDDLGFLPVGELTELRRLRFSDGGNCCFLTPDGLAPLARLTKLEDLDLGALLAGAPRRDLLLRPLRSLPGLTKLDLSHGYSNTPRCLGALASLACGASLRTLDLSHCQKITGDPRVVCPDVFEVEMADGVQLAGAHAGWLAELRGERVARVVAALVNVARRLPNVTWLDLSNVGMLTDEGVAALAAGMRGLRHLELARCSGLTDGLAAALEPTRATLEYLAVGNCSGIHNAFLEGMRGFHALHTLDVQHSGDNLTDCVEDGAVNGGWRSGALAGIFARPAFGGLRRLWVRRSWTVRVRSAWPDQPSPPQWDPKALGEALLQSRPDLELVI